MKVKIEMSTRKVFTIYEAPIMNKMIEVVKNDDITVKELCKIALNALYSENWRIYDAKAVLSKNSRIYNYYFDNSGAADIWVECLGFNSFRGAIEIGFYLSDIYQLSDENRVETTRHFYKNEFTR